MNNVCAVIICYNPEPEQLSQLLTAILAQVKEAVIIDNSPEENQPQVQLLTNNYQNYHYFPQTENQGVARGYNLGARWAEENSCSHILLLDQDSLPDLHMVQSLLDAEHALTKQGLQIATVAPQYCDRRDPTICSTFRNSHGLQVKRVRCNPTNSQIIQIDQAISSGSLISLESFTAVGVMANGFFIDMVDTEWVLRAKSKGYMAYGVCRAFMSHQIGDRFIHLPIINRNVAIHTPLRLYYLIRNSILLYRKPYVSYSWAIRDGVNLLAKLAISLVTSGQRKSQFMMAWRGVVDGINSVDGPHQRSITPDRPKKTL